MCIRDRVELEDILVMVGKVDIIMYLDMNPLMDLEEVVPVEETMPLQILKDMEAVEQVYLEKGQVALQQEMDQVEEDLVVGMDMLVLVEKQHQILQQILLMEPNQEPVVTMVAAVAAALIPKLVMVEVEQ